MEPISPRRRQLYYEKKLVTSTDDVIEWLHGRPWLLSLSELKPKKLYFATVSTENFSLPLSTSEAQFLCTDKEYVYDRFFSDFGPLHLGHLCRYYRRLQACLRCKPNTCIIHCTGPDPEKRANAAFLIAAFATIFFHLTPDQVSRTLEQGRNPIPFKPFQDASLSGIPHTITLQDCLSGVKDAKSLGFFDFDDLDVEELEEKRDMLGGDLSWLVPGRFLAFCGPSVEPGSPYPRPEQYIDYFHENNVTAVVRLNRKNYDAKKFTDEGIKHFDVFLVDGSTPSKAVLQEFLDIAENTTGAIAVHCKAGLGRTGTLVGAYLIKHYRMTALAAIAWLRICRPGSVIGNQQVWLQANERYLMRQGDIYRKQAYGDADRMDLPKFGVYSKRAKLEPVDITTPRTQTYNVQNLLRRDSQFLPMRFSASQSVGSSKENHRGGRLRSQGKEIQYRPHTLLPHLASFKWCKALQLNMPRDSECREMKRLDQPPSSSLARRSELENAELRRTGYIAGNAACRSNMERARGHLDSGDVATSSLTQGDKLNAIKLLRARENGSIEHRLQEFASLRPDFGFERGA